MSERNDRVRGDIEDARETVRIGGERVRAETRERVGGEVDSE